MVGVVVDYNVSKCADTKLVKTVRGHSEVSIGDSVHYISIYHSLQSIESTEDRLVTFF